MFVLKKLKFLSAVLLVVIVMSFSVQVFAADSPGLPGPPINEGSIDLNTVEGKPHGAELLVAGVSSSDQAALESVVTAWNPSGAIIGILDLKLQQDDENGVAQFIQPNGGIKITVTKEGIKATDIIWVLHLHNGNTTRMQAICFDGGFSFTTNSFSAFAFIYGGEWRNPPTPTPTPAPSGGGGGGGGTTATSPQTGVYA